MKPNSFLLSLCSCLVRSATIAAPPETEAIKAGPFSVTAPKVFAEGIVVEKVPLKPLYTAEEWKRAKGEPMLVLKPSYENRPQHWAIRFPKLAPKWYAYDPKEAGEYPTAPQILIHKADEWDIAFEGEVTDAGKTKKRLRAEMLRWSRRKVDYPGPGYRGGSFSFATLKKEIRFAGGRGVRAVGQLSIEPELIRRGGLHYFFIGLSNDNTCQIIATFPLDAPGLPDESPEATHLGYTTKDYPRLSRQFDIYETAAKKWLMKRAADFTPSSESLDAMISSLEVKKWE